MNTRRILHLEDNPRDAELVAGELALAGSQFEVHSVHDRSTYEAAVAQTQFDLILSDYDIPGYDGLSALTCARQQQPDVPFILVSGAIGEERAVECIRCGVTDYVLKQHLEHLLPIVLTALHQADERRRHRVMEAALRESEERFRTIVEAEPQCVKVVDLDGCLVEMNVAGLAMVEADSLAQVKGFPMSDLVAPEYRMSFNETLHAAARGEAQAMTFEIVGLKGARRWVESHVVPLRDAAGRTKHLLGVTRDITEQRQNEIRLRDQAEMLDQAHGSIVLTDLEGRIMYWNAGAEQLYGWTREEAIGHLQDEFCDPEETALLAAVRRETIDKGTWHGELRLMNKAGQVRLIESHRTLVRDASGKPKGHIAISVDLTEQKKLEAQLLRAQRMESIGTLAGGIAHDLNNVLGPILLSLPLLRESLADERDLELLDQIETTALRGAAIVRQVLTFARGADGERFPVQVRHLINETRKILGDTFPKSIHLDFAAPDDTWIINGDPTQLQQVLMNLCVNARDAMGHDGSLTVAAENVVLDEHYAAMNVAAKAGAYVAIRVTDTGPGIPESIRERIFDPFFTTKELGKGTGLGLSTSMSIVKGHGGFIHVYSEPGKGTTFKVFLPADVTPAEEVQHLRPIELPRGRGETILVVDDEQAILNAIKRSLQRHGYNVITANDGTEALGLYAQQSAKIVLVLTDMMMPVLDGAATARALMSMNPNVKVIISSGLATDGATVKANQAGVRHFLSKPYTVEAVLKMLRQVIDEPLAPTPPSPA